jgi:hypothetical protein
MKQLFSLNSFSVTPAKPDVHSLGLQEVWEKSSSIRSRPRRIVELDSENMFFYPESRQPLCIHPLVVAKGIDAKRYILTQSLFKFMHDVAILETEVVNSGAILVANNKLDVNFPESMRHDALSVIIDEAYHAYVAKDLGADLLERQKNKISH